LIAESKQRFKRLKSGTRHRTMRKLKPGSEEKNGSRTKTDRNVNGPPMDFMQAIERHRKKLANQQTHKKF